MNKIAYLSEITAWYRINIFKRILAYSTTDALENIILSVFNSRRY